MADVRVRFDEIAGLKALEMSCCGDAESCMALKSLVPIAKELL
jgi:hypothetical protein